MRHNNNLRRPTPPVEPETTARKPGDAASSALAAMVENGKLDTVAATLRTRGNKASVGRCMMVVDLCACVDLFDILGMRSFDINTCHMWCSCKCSWSEHMHKNKHTLLLLPQHDKQSTQGFYVNTQKKKGVFVYLIPVSIWLPTD